MNIPHAPDQYLGQKIVLISLQNDEIVIENCANSVIPDSVLVAIADTVLSWFCDGILSQPHIIQDFKESMLTYLPTEGGIIPIENVYDWIELSHGDNSRLLTVNRILDNGKPQQLQISAYPTHQGIS